MSRRKTGPSPAVVAIVQERSSGCCERCGNDWATQLHHRRPRGMGGTKREGSNTASALLHLCQRCHAYIESHRWQALTLGWLVLQDGDPVATPVRTRHGVVMLTDDGGIEATE
jgi:5-methylcytosine-specific restriction protein A